MAEDRKARLAALAARAGRSKKPDASSSDDKQLADDDANNTTNTKDDTPSLKFRNYVPKDSSLEHGNIAGPDKDASKQQQQQQHKSQQSVNAKLEYMAQRAKRQKTEKDEEEKKKTPLEQALLKAKLENVMEAFSTSGGGGGATAAATATGDLETSMSALAPKKVNWDLKRDLKSKLDRLERRTERAIVELLRERLEKEATEEVDGMEEDSDLD